MNGTQARDGDAGRADGPTRRPEQGRGGAGRADGYSTRASRRPSRAALVLVVVAVGVLVGAVAAILVEVL